MANMMGGLMAGRWELTRAVYLAAMRAAYSVYQMVGRWELTRAVYLRANQNQHCSTHPSIFSTVPKQAGFAHTKII